MAGTSVSKDNGFTTIALGIAFLNFLLFGAMFVLMHYFELVGSDTAYFDDGSYNNLNMINAVLGSFGLRVDPKASPEITTAGYSICYGVFLLSTFFAILVVGRKSAGEVEITDAKV